MSTCEVVTWKHLNRDSLLYLVHKHQASHLHYDFRLEWQGVLLSWAVPKGPSLNHSIKRLAMRVEDHSVEYGDFEGVISEGQYGAGTVMLWDHGTWMPEESDVDICLRKGELKFSLAGRKLKGSWALIRTAAGRSHGSERQRWLLIKHRDQFASPRDILVEQPRSVLSNRLLIQIARDNHGNVAKAAQGDPAGSGEVM